MYKVSGLTQGRHLVLFVGYLNWEAEKEGRKYGFRVNSWG